MRELSLAEEQDVNGGLLATCLFIGAVLVADALLIGVMVGMQQEMAE